MAHNDPFAGQTVDADLVYYLDTSGAYTPALTATTTNPNLGADGEAAGWWHRNGHFISAEARFLFSGTGLSAGSGEYRISLPFSADLSILTASGTSGLASLIGSARLRDNSTGSNSQIVGASLRTADELVMNQEGQNLFVTHSAPIPWAESDRIIVQFMYLADPASLPS